MCFMDSDLIKMKSLTHLRVDAVEWIVEEYPPLGVLVKSVHINHSMDDTARLESYLPLLPNLEQISTLRVARVTDSTIADIILL